MVKQKSVTISQRLHVFLFSGCPFWFRSRLASNHCQSVQTSDSQPVNRSDAGPDVLREKGQKSNKTDVSN